MENLSLKRSLIRLSFVAFLIVTALSAATILWASDVREDLLATRNITIDDTARFGQLQQEADPSALYAFVLTPENYSYDELSGKNRLLFYLVTAFMVALPVCYVVAGALAVAVVFYKIKLQKPIATLQMGIRHIAADDLDFSIDYPAQDELGALCDTLENMRKQLDQNSQNTWRMLQEKDALTASVSHDLRTPITVIKGYLEYLEKATAKGALQEDVLRRTTGAMMRSAERLERYVDCIRDIKKMEEMKLQYEELPVESFLSELNEEFSLLAQKEQKQFTLIRKIRTQMFCADKQMLFKILENLFNNALRYAKMEITLLVVETDRYVDFRMEDDGCGFSQDTLELVTNWFYSSGAKEGHYGIGLSICKILCEKMGGSLLCYNRPCGGASVTSRIPK